MATTDEVVKIVTVMAAAYPHFKLTEETMKVYGDLLSDIDREELAVAAQECIATSEFFPTIAALRARVIRHRALINEIPDHGEAWGDVMDVVHRLGFEEAALQHLHVFKHPCTEIAVRRIGWRELCFTDENNLFALRAQFRDIFNQLVGRTQAVDSLLPATAEFIAVLADRLSATRRLESGKPNYARR